MEDNKNKKKSKIEETLSDSIVDKISVKRVIIALSFIVLVISYILDMFESYTVNVKFAELFAWILSAGLFGVASEKFLINRR